MCMAFIMIPTIHSGFRCDCAKRKALTEDILFLANDSTDRNVLVSGKNVDPIIHQRLWGSVLPEPQPTADRNGKKRGSVRVGERN